jgi:hypothetical protein
LRQHALKLRISSTRYYNPLTVRCHLPNPIQDIYAELLELLELYCEVLSARFGLLDLLYVSAYAYGTLEAHVREIGPKSLILEFLRL